MCCSLATYTILVVFVLEQRGPYLCDRVITFCHF